MSSVKFPLLSWVCLMLIKWTPVTNLCHCTEENSWTTYISYIKTPRDGFQRSCLSVVFNILCCSPCNWGQQREVQWAGRLLCWTSVMQFITFSCAVSRYTGAAMICLAWMSSAVLHWVASRFLARLVERKCYSAEEEDSLRPLFEAIVYSRSWVRKSVNWVMDMCCLL